MIPDLSGKKVAIVAMGKRDLGPEGALEIEEITEQKVA